MSEADDQTTIRLSKETKSRLDAIKVHERQSAEEAIQKLLERNKGVKLE